MMSLWPGSYQDREEMFNYEWNAAIDVCPSKLFTQQNIVLKCMMNFCCHF